MTLYVDAGYFTDDYIIEAAAPVEDIRPSGGAWLPIIYLDKDGKEVGLEAAIEIAVESVSQDERPRVEQIAQRVVPQIDKLEISANVAKDMAAILAVLDDFDAILANAIRRDVEQARRAAIEDEVALILLMAM